MKNLQKNHPGDYIYLTDYVLIFAYKQFFYTKKLKKKGMSFKVKKTLKVLSIVLVMSIVVMALAACGSGVEDPASGRYNCTSLEFLGFGSEPGGEYIELSSGGKGKMDILNGETSITWKLNGEDISVTYFFLTYEGTLKDGVLVLDMLGSKYTFVKGDIDSSNTADTADVTDDAVITDDIGNETEESVG